MASSGALPRNAILIDEGRWIEHVDLTGRCESAFNVDPLIKELEPMWSMLETACVAGCCGIDAFDFTPENIANAASNLNSNDVCASLLRLRTQLHEIDAHVYVSHRLNSYSDRTVFDALLQHLQARFSALSHGA